MNEFERKPDGGLNNWIETYEAMGGGENDAEMLCLLLELRRRRENQTKAERERDELRAEQAEHDEQIARMESKFSLAKRALDSKTARCDRAEAELRRRDAAAGEAVGEVRLGEYGSDGTRPASVLCLHEQADWENFPDGTKLYAAAQPQMVVELPAVRKSDDVAYGGAGAFTMGISSGFNECLAIVTSALDAANVKYEVKP